MKILLIVLVAAGLAACNDGAGPAGPSTRAVDSVVRVAPDTIKAISVDSVKYKVRPKS
jgi:hypothetical protein